MRIVFIGPPGAGKGTQSANMIRELGILHLSTGEMLRKAQQEKTRLGRLASDYINTGQLVPDPLILQLIGERLVQPDCRRGYLLDGFPRTLGQAKALDEYLHQQGTPLDVVIELVVDEAELTRRLSDRGRSDDNPEIIRQRLRSFQDQTRPLIRYYSDKGLMEAIDAIGTTEEVFERIMQAIQRHTPTA